jgi:hypothetical protein
MICGRCMVAKPDEADRSTSFVLGKAYQNRAMLQAARTPLDRRRAARRGQNAVSAAHYRKTDVRRDRLAGI